MAPAPHGMGRALAPVGALPPYLPRGFYSLFSTYRERDTHTIERREIEEHTTFHTTLTQHDTTPSLQSLQTLQTLQTLRLGTEKV